MLIGVVLALTWAVLLVRYPARALPISLGAVLGLALVGAWLLWQEQREANRLAHLELRLEYQPARCPGDRPLEVQLVNRSDVPLKSLRWEVAAYAPGDDLNLARRSFEAPRYYGPGDLQPGQAWRNCMPLPELRRGFRPSTLMFRAESLEGRFAE